MATVLQPPPPQVAPQSARPKRSAWRQRLVEAERGVTLGMRGDSTLFVHLFVGSVIVATGFVLGIDVNEWALLILSIAVVLSAEMFNKVLIELSRLIVPSEDGAAPRCLKIGTAAVFVTISGSLAAMGLIFARHLWMMFQA